MQENPNKYIFEENRQTIIASFGLLAVLAAMLCVLMLIFPERRHVFSMCFIMLFAGTIILITYCHKNHKFFAAKYAITGNSVVMQIGKDLYAIAAEDAYFLSIVRLFQPCGKSYRYKKYIVLWQDSPPQEEISPIVLLRKNQCIILPYSNDILFELGTRFGIKNFPEYPKTLYHPPEFHQ